MLILPGNNYDKAFLTSCRTLFYKQPVVKQCLAKMSGKLSNLYTLVIFNWSDNQLFGAEWLNGCGLYHVLKLCCM